MFILEKCLVASLLLALLAQPALAAKTCLSHSFDQVSRCRLRHVDQSMPGNPPPTPAPAPFPPNLLASQIGQRVATGEAYPISGGDGKDWVLLISAARLTPDSNVIADDYAADKQLAIIRYQPVKKAALPEESEQPEPRPTLQLRALGQTRELLRSENADEERAEAELSLPECIDPEPSSANPGIYPDIGTDYRWLRLSPQHRVLAASIHRGEGYAGGGGSFDAELLLDLRDGKLVPIACYAVSHYQMFGGEWNPDGTRQHPESSAKWKRIIQPGGEWPALRLKATTPGTPSATLIWNPQRGQYVGQVDVRSGKKK